MENPPPDLPLTDAEDAEEAQLMARLAAYDESPEGRAQSRIFKLTLQRFSSGGLSTAEQSELDSLSTLYPEPPLDPNDPLDKEVEAFSKAVKEARRRWATDRVRSGARGES